ncbi:hypothetical protein [Amycolatopsis orientalis]|uniref:hypothetical protein n=1 Tax=Amycolatopsis orientalis TaxID=31958 RepID=UPI00055C2CB5|nr:hypothetical protein [Amycolatopsis orientalis]
MTNTMSATETRVIDGVTYVWVPCHRCGGTGHFGPVSVMGGKCFGCTDESGQAARGRWVAETTVMRQAADKRRRDAARKAREAKRLDAFQARTDAAVAALVAVGFTNVAELMRSDDPREAYPAQLAAHSVRDYGTDPAEAYADWLNR